MRLPEYRAKKRRERVEEKQLVISPGRIDAVLSSLSKPSDWEGVFWWAVFVSRC